MNEVAKIEGTEIVSVNPFATNNQQQTPPTVGGGFMTAEMQRSIAEVQAQFMVAMARPRNPLVSVDKMLAESQRSKLAEVALYSFSRGGTKISGLSIRALEMVARNWGNIRYGFRVLDRSQGRSSVQAYAIDLENNIPVERIFEVRHWRDTKDGGYAIKDERDIYELEANQAQRRVRACLEALIPGDVLDSVEQQIKMTLNATADLSPEGIKKMLSVFSKIGVNKAMIEARIQRKIDAIDASQKVSLSAVLNSIRDGMSGIEDWFDMNLADKEPQKSGQLDLKKKIEERKEEAAATEKKEPSDDMFPGDKPSKNV